MSSSQGMLYFQYSFQGKRKLLLATARDDKNRGLVNNDMEQSVVESNLEDGKVRTPGEMAASPTQRHGEYVWNNIAAVKVR